MVTNSLLRLNTECYHAAMQWLRSLLYHFQQVNCYSREWSRTKKRSDRIPHYTWYALMMAWTARWSSITLTSGMASVTAPVAGTVATAIDLAPTAGDWPPGRIAGGDTYAEPGGAPSRALRKNTSHDCQRTQTTLSNFTKWQIDWLSHSTQNKFISQKFFPANLWVNTKTTRSI